jgi:hypothetical protein
MDLFQPFRMPNIIRLSPETNEYVPNIKNYLILHQNDLISNGWFHDQRKEAVVSIMILVGIMVLLVIVFTFT